jgi:drug/metabolite transporter (DMT)-like permease
MDPAKYFNLTWSFFLPQAKSRFFAKWDKRHVEDFPTITNDPKAHVKGIIPVIRRWVRREIPDKLEWIGLRQFIYPVSLIAAITCISIYSTNEALAQMDVATLNFSKSITPILTAIVSFFVLRKVEPAPAYPLFIFMMVGVSFALRKPDQGVDVITRTGMAIVFTSALTRAVANVLSEHLIKAKDAKGKEVLNPLVLSFYSNPVEVLVLAPLVIFRELPEWSERNQVADGGYGMTILITMIIIDTLAVFALRGVTLFTIRETSSLSVTVFAQLKFAASMLIENLFFEYEIDILRICGALMVVGSTLAYGYLKKVRGAVGASVPNVNRL